MIFSDSDRYGLPVNFQAMLLHPNKKNTKRLRDVLNQLYGHLDSSAVQGSGPHDVCIVNNYVLIESKGLMLLVPKPIISHCSESPLIFITCFTNIHFNTILPSLSQYSKRQLYQY